MTHTTQEHFPEQYAFIQSLYSDNHYTSKEYGQQLAEISDKALSQRLKDGNWQYDEDAGTLMKYDNIRDLFTNNIVKDGQKYLIVDVARYGRDKTVFNFFDGLESYKRETDVILPLSTIFQRPTCASIVFPVNVSDSTATLVV
jgi:hypothetical protein